jgi:Pyruvate/2-oxoacid:ferredoxin oxidoreductase delta subunit
MAEDIYERLREHLDSLPTGYPKTPSGVEIRILKKLFTGEEAEMARQLQPVPETAEQVALRLGQDPKAVSDLLYRMSQKGLILRVKSRDVYQYMATMFVIGIMEFQVNRLDRELCEMIDEYMREKFAQEMIRPQTPQLRVVPVQQSLTGLMEIQPYDELRKIVESQKTIAVADCICRKKSSLMGHPCTKPLESCLFFGMMGEYYIENGMGRRIAREEALEILRKNEEAGLVPNPANAQKVGGICSCCGCCCGILKAIKLHNHPSSLVKSNYFAQVDQDLCSSCETCLERCQMEAIYMDDDWAAIDLKRCVGCGLCVTTCPSKALSLRPKSPKERYVPPAKPIDTYIQIAKERGKM